MTCPRRALTHSNADILLHLLHVLEVSLLDLIRLSLVVATLISNPR